MVWWNTDPADRYRYEGSDEQGDSIRPRGETMPARTRRLAERVRQDHGVSRAQAEEAVSHLAHLFNQKTERPLAPEEFGFASSMHGDDAWSARQEDALNDPKTWAGRRVQDISLDHPVHATQDYVHRHLVAHNLFHPGKRGVPTDHPQSHTLGDPDLDPHEVRERSRIGDRRYLDEQSSAARQELNATSRFVQMRDGELRLADGHHRVAADMILGKRSTPGMVIHEDELDGRHHASQGIDVVSFFREAEAKTGAMLDLYHRTSPEAAEAIHRERRMTSKETRGHGRPVYFSTHRDGENASGYGEGVVHVRVPEHMAELDDEFPDGEQHYSVDAGQLRPHHFVDPPKKTAATGGFRTLGPAELGELRSDDMPGKIKTIRHKIRRHSPGYYDELKGHIAEHGVQAPILVRGDKVMDGNHRAAIAHELGLSAPVGDYDDERHYAAAEAARRSSGWSDWEKREEHAADRDDSYGRTAVKTAAGKLPEGLTFQYKDRGDSHKVMAIHPEHGQIGQLTWFKKARPGGNGESCRTCQGDVEGPHKHPAGEVDGIEVDDAFQRRGVTSAMWQHAHSLRVTPKPKHSGSQTDAGKAWAQHVGQKTAAVTHKASVEDDPLKKTTQKLQDAGDEFERPVKKVGFAGHVGFSKSLADEYGCRWQNPDHEDDDLHRFIDEGGRDANLWRRSGTFGKINLKRPIYATQSHVFRSNVERYSADPDARPLRKDSEEGDEYLGDEHPLFVTHRGRLHVTDGHHRVAGALQRGDENILGWHYDADKHGITPQQDKTAYYHGTAVEGVEQVLPAGQYAYATTDQEAARRHAKTAAEASGRPPVVYVVEPLGAVEQHGAEAWSTGWRVVGDI